MTERLCSKSAMETKTVAKLSAAAKASVNEYVRSQFRETVKLPAEYEKITEEINFSGYAILRTAHRSDEYCKILLGEHKKHYKPKDVKAMLWALYEKSKPFFERRKLLLCTNFCGENLFAAVDEEGFYYAVLELLLNAAENSPKNSRIKFSLCLAETCLKITVSDKGKGMDCEILSNCCRPFFSTDPSKSGLGLALVKNFAEKSGGRVGITSEKGKGTAVSIYIPAVKDCTEEIAKSPNAKILGGKFSPVDIMLSGIEKR